MTVSVQKKLAYFMWLVATRKIVSLSLITSEGRDLIVLGHRKQIRGN